MSSLHRTLICWLLLAAAAGAQTLASAHAPQPPLSGREEGRVVARVNGAPIYERRLNVEMQRIFPYYSMHGAKVPDKYKDEIRGKAMDRLINEELAYQEAVRRDMRIPPTKWNKRMAEIRGDFGSQEEFEAVIQREFGSMDALKKFVRRTMLIEQVWDTEITRKSVVSDAAIAKYYAANKSKFVRPEAVAFQTISFLVKPNGGSDDRAQAHKRADEALAKAKAAKTYQDFGLLAEKISEDDWRVMMGDHGLVHRIALAPEYKAAGNLKVGETSGVVESEKGFHVIRVNKRVPQKQMTLAEMRSNIRQSLQHDTTQQRNDALLASLIKKAKIERY